MSTPFVEQVLAAADFVGIASRYTRLRRSGRQWLGLCPFHSERHPSFYVEPERRIWKCFGCGAGGDLFRFVMLAEGLTFGRALRFVRQWGLRQKLPRSCLSRSVSRLHSQRGVWGVEPPTTERASWQYVPSIFDFPSRECAAERAVFLLVNKRITGHE